MGTTLYGWGRMFDLPSPSPYVMKTDVQLQMMGVNFDRAIADLESVSKHKAPYVMDDGVLVQDSTFIRWHFEQKLGIDLDEGLSPSQRGTAWVLEKMLEHRLVNIILCERWLIDDNFERGPRQFFAGVPQAMRETVIQQVRSDLSKSMYGTGFSRFSRTELMQMARADIAAVAAMLGDQPYFGGLSPRAADASGLAVLAGCATRFFDSELPDIVCAHANLTAYIERMQQRFFAEDRWPRMS